MKSNLIVYPTDFSSCAENALVYAMAIAQVMKCEIKVIHAVNIPGIVASEENPRRALDRVEELEKDAEKRLKEVFDKVKSNNVECSCGLIKGKIISWLPAYLKELDPKLVIMGTTGTGGFENKLMGSLTYKLINSTNFPVLSIPEKALYNGITNIIFGTEYQEKDIEHIRFLVELAQAFKAHIQVVHVAKGKFLYAEEEAFLNDFSQAVKKEINYENLDFSLLYWRNVQERLDVLLKESKADLLALVSRKRNFMDRLFEQSLTKKMIYHTHTPLLTFS